MDEMQITRAENRDQPQLHRLWETVFGDPPELVEAFFECFPPESAGWVARRGETICSCAYLLPGNWLLNGQEYRPMGYVYAVATAPSERKKGYAGRLMRAMAREADERGLLLYTRPAEDSLFSWYRETLGAEQTVRSEERLLLRGSDAAVPEVTRISAAAYGTIRETLLAETPHVLMGENLLRLQETYLAAAGGGMFEVGSGCCACELREDTVFLSETLGPDEDAIAQAMMRLFGTERAILRCPGGSAPLAAYRGARLPEETRWGFFLE